MKKRLEALKNALAKYELAAKAHGSRLASVGLTSETLDDDLLKAKMDLSVVIEDWAEFRVAQAREDDAVQRKKDHDDAMDISFR